MAGASGRPQGISGGVIGPADRRQTCVRTRSNGLGISRQIYRIHEHRARLDLPATAGAHEPSELLGVGPAAPRGLQLERAERPQVTLRTDHFLDDRRTRGADQLVLQVGVADEETELFHVGGAEVRADAGPLERASKVAHLGRIAEACEDDVGAGRAIAPCRRRHRWRRSSRGSQSGRIFGRGDWQRKHAQRASGRRGPESGAKATFPFRLFSLDNSGSKPIVALVSACCMPTDRQA